MRRLIRVILALGGVVVVLHGHAPRSVLVARLGAAFGARGDDYFVGALECSRFLEAPMSSLFHAPAPISLSPS